MIFTCDEPDWQFIPYADPSDVVIGSAFGFHSASVALSIDTAFGTYNGGAPNVAYIPVPILLGVQYSVKAWVNGDDAVESTPLVFEIANLELSFLEPLYKHQLTSGWELVDLGTFTALETDSILFVGMLNFLVQDPAPAHDGRWVVDDIEISPVIVTEEDMAVYLTAFSIRAIIAKLQASLNAEIAFIEAELTTKPCDLPAVTGWYIYRKDNPSPDVTVVEVYETGLVTFPLKKQDLSAYTAGGRRRTISEHSIVIALTHANRGDADTSNQTLLEQQMAERSRLYAAAIYRVIRNNPNCGYVENLIVYPERLEVFASHPGIDPNTRRVARVEYTVRVEQQEDAISETAAGAVTLPPFTPETP